MARTTEVRGQGGRNEAGGLAELPRPRAERMGAERRTAHGDTERLALRGAGVADIGVHPPVKLGAEEFLERGVAIGEADRHTARGDASERRGARHRIRMEGGHVLDVVAVRQRVAVVRRHPAPRLRTGRQAPYRAERERPGLDVAHPADGVVERPVEGGDGERRRIFEEHAGRARAGRRPRAVGQGHVDGRAGESTQCAGVMHDARRGGEHRPRAGAERGDRGAERGVRSRPGR